jgi:hypothetical protein
MHRIDRPGHDLELGVWYKSSGLTHFSPSAMGPPWVKYDTGSAHDMAPSNKMKYDQVGFDCKEVDASRGA